MYDPQKHKEYYSKVKDKKIKYTVAYTKKRIQNDPGYKQRHMLGIKMVNFISSIKNANTFLGCDIVYFIKHIEEKFTKEMDWNNHGIVWELDHIKPISNFDLTQESEQIKCFHYTNLQPLLKHKNRSKLNKHEE